MSKIGVKNRNLTYSFYLYISYLTFIKPYDIAGTHQSISGYLSVKTLYLTEIKNLFTYSIMSRVDIITTFILFATVISGKLTTDEVEYIKTPSKNVETKFREISHKNFFQHRGVITGVSSYAHIAIDFDFNWVHKSNREACSCISDLEKNLYQIGSMTSRNMARDQTKELRRTCDRLTKTTSDLDKIFGLQKTMYFDQAQDVCGGVIDGYEIAIGDIFQGLRSLAVGKLSPTLVDPVNLRSSLEKIDS